jgi:hypothetical protein
LMLKEELLWATNPLPGPSEDHPPSGGKPSEVEVGEEPTAIPLKCSSSAETTSDGSAQVDRAGRSHYAWLL